MLYVHAHIHTHARTQTHTHTYAHANTYKLTRACIARTEICLFLFENNLDKYKYFNLKEDGCMAMDGNDIHKAETLEVGAHRKPVEDLMLWTCFTCTP